MRGRKPRPLTLAAEDRPILEGVARHRRLCWFQVQHARTVLAVAAGEPIQSVASRLGCDPSTIWRVCRRYEQGGLSKLLLDDPRLGRPPGDFPPPSGLGSSNWRAWSPWPRDCTSPTGPVRILPDKRSPTGSCMTSAPRTVRQILHDVDLQPHRTRYWRTARLDALFKERAEKVLWCYGNAERLAREGIWTIAVDEVPNLRVLQREPIRRAIPGQVEQQEFEYTRHGTVNLLLFLVVHTGRMEVAVEAKKDADHYIRALRAFRRRHRGLDGVYLIQDGDPSHTAGDTAGYWSGCRGWWRPRFTPAHASWLNQAELLVGAFGYRYPETGLLERSGYVHRACRGIRAGVQPALRPPVRVDLDQPEDAAVVRQARPLNSLHDFVPGPLAGATSGGGSRRRTGATGGRTPRPAGNTPSGRGRSPRANPLRSSSSPATACSHQAARFRGGSKAAAGTCTLGVIKVADGGVHPHRRRYAPRR